MSAQLTTPAMSKKVGTSMPFTRKQCLIAIVITCVVLVILMGGSKDLTMRNPMGMPLKNGTGQIFQVSPVSNTPPQVGVTTKLYGVPGRDTTFHSSPVSKTQSDTSITSSKTPPSKTQPVSVGSHLNNSLTNSTKLVPGEGTREPQKLRNSTGSVPKLTESVKMMVQPTKGSEKNKTQTVNVNVKHSNDTSGVKTHNNTNVKDRITNKTAIRDDIHFFGTIKLNTEVNEGTLEPYCAMESNWHKHLYWPDTPSDLTDWRHSRRRKCPQFVINDNLGNSRRLKYSLSCSAGKPMLVPSITNSSSDIDVVSLNNTCLAAFTNSCCNNDQGVPNVLHLVWYFKKPMMFQTFLSILSVVRFVRPCLILFHGEFIPYGRYWDYVIHLYPNILHVKTPRPLSIFGHKITHHEHSGDLMRIYALMQLGGIYIDTDVIVLRDVKPLRKYDITMCRQSGGQFLLNSFIMAKKNATFLTHWVDGYKQYKNDSYVYNSMQMNNDLARKLPGLIHIENGTMCCPDVLVGVNLQSPMIYDWSKLYGFHIYSRQINFPWDINLIRNFNTTFGAMLRHVVYGNKELCL